MSGIEQADQLFQRMWVELNRRCADVGDVSVVFIGDGAQSIWDPVGNLADSSSMFIMGFYHLTDHVAELCRLLFGR